MSHLMISQTHHAVKVTSRQEIYTGKIKEKFAPEQVTKAQMGSKGIALLFLQPMVSTA